MQDDPATWPDVVQVQGLRYEAIDTSATLAQRLAWLHKDPAGYLPQAYEQLAALYRRHGQDDHARSVLLAGQRHRRRSLHAGAVAWGYVQDVVLGYGYRPLRAALWFAMAWVAGTVYFQIDRPRPISGDDPSPLIPALYTLDLLLPVVNLRQEDAFQPGSVGAWVAALTIIIGWALATTIAVAVARILRRS